MNNPDWKRPRFIQGSKSSNLKFKKSICALCNSSRTQSADRDFDEFHSANSANLERVVKDREQLGKLVRPVASERERDVFRYFAKLLCCFLAEVDGPRPKAVGAFAVSLAEQNPILLSVSEDPALAEIKQRAIGTGWVAHGGLWLTFDSRSVSQRKLDLDLRLVMFVTSIGYN